MNIEMSMQVLAVVCGVVLFLVCVKRKIQFFLEIMLRAGVGTILILWANKVLVQLGIQVLVGINFWSLLTSGILGIPGVALLFVISALQKL